MGPWVLMPQDQSAVKSCFPVFTMLTLSAQNHQAVSKTNQAYLPHSFYFLVIFMVFLPLKITSLTKIYLFSLQETSQANIEKPALCTVEEKYPLGLEFNSIRGAGLDCDPSLTGL